MNGGGGIVTEEPKPQASGGELAGSPPAQGEGGQPQQPRTYTDADFERARKKWAKEADTLKAQLAEMQEKQKSDHEKAIEAAARKAREEVLGEVERTKRSDAITRTLMGLGIPETIAEDLTVAVASKYAEDIDSVDTAKARAKEYGEGFIGQTKLNAQPRPAGIPGAPSGPKPPQDLSREAVAKMSKKDFQAALPQIVEARQREALRG